MPVTAAEIAEAAQVSRATVSRILGDHAHRFSAQTRERVERAAARLGYRPNASARAVRTGRFRTLGLLQAGNEGPGRMSNALLEGILSALTERNLHLLATRLESDAGELPPTLNERCLDGLLVAYTHDVPAHVSQAIAELDLPTLWINTDQVTPNIGPDDESGGRLLAQHLLAQGHRRIAWLCSVGGAHHSVAARFSGVRAELSTAGIEPVIFQASGKTLPLPERRALVERLLSDPQRPSAVIAYGGMDVGTLHVAAAARGLRVPEDLSLATFGDAVGTDTGIAMCTALIPWQTIGRAAVSRLLDDVEISDQVRIPCELRVGTSTAPPSGRLP